MDFVGDLDDKVGAVALVVVCRNKVEEADESKGQVFCLGVLQSSKNDLHDRDKVLLQDVPIRVSPGSKLQARSDLRREVRNHTLQKFKPMSLVGSG